METRGPQPTQSVAQAHVANSEPGPPPSSLHSLPPTLRQLLMQTVAEECGGGGGDAVRTPQSAPYAHTGHSEPELPSSQSESEAKKHVAMPMLSGVTCSNVSASILNSKTVSGSPSSHKPSEAYLHVPLHCASVAFTIRAKKTPGAIRGAERDHVD